MNQVIIAGAGPVGLMLAHELGLAGVAALVVDGAEPDARTPFGMAINSGVVELLEQRGLMAPLRELGMEIPQAQFAHLWLDPARLPGGHPYTVAIPYDAVERCLAEAARERGAEIRYGTAVAGLAQDADGVTVELRSPAGAERVRCGYLAGCDGADSTVRELAGISFPGVDYPFNGLIGEVGYVLGDPLLGRLGVDHQDTGFVTVAPGGEMALRVTTGEFGADPADPDKPPTYEELCATVERISGTPMTTGRLRWLRRWRARTRQADRYREGRVFLAGDAAHVHFPLGGQALSTGLEDAVNLGWKLAARIHGWAPAGLLDTYHTERQPAGARACHTTSAQVALLHPMDRVSPLRDVLAELIRFEDVNNHLVAMVGGLDVRYPMETGHPAAGRRLPNVPLTTGAGATSLARLLHDGRGVLLEQTGCRGGVDGWADRVDTVAAEACDELPASRLLIRPDGRVAWAGDTVTGGLDEALRAWFGEPAPAAR